MTRNCDIFILNNNLLKSNKFGSEIGVFFTTRLGGKSYGDFKSNNMAYQVGDNKDDVLKNREKLASDIEIDINNFVFAQQTHSTNISYISKEDCGKGLYSFNSGIKDTDVLYTYDKGIALSCFYADCTPIYIYDPRTELICIIHSGWQGTVEGILKKTLLYFKEKENIDLEQIKVIIGPSIKKDSFIVDKDVYVKFKEQLGGENLDIIFENGNKWNIDLNKYNERVLKELGVKTANIFISHIDTFIEEDLFSYRRENITGRMLGVICKY